MNDPQIEESIQIAEKLAEEICTGQSPQSPLTEKWKEDLPREISFHDSIDVEKALRETNKRIAPPSVRFSIRTIGIAASFLLIVGASALWLWNEHQEKNTLAWVSSAPGSSKPSIVAQDNQSVVLSQNRLMVKENQLIGTAQDGKRNVAIELKPNNQFNRLSVPAGGEYELTLEDGTVVQVNAASELLFPTHFKPHIRQVHLQGEACFKVKSDKASPFYVQLGTLNVQVTGTSFNIKSYQEEEDIRIALIEGSVNIREGQKLLTTLTPGDLFTYRKSNRDFRVSEANLSAVTSWTNGQFIFYNEAIGNIMRDLSRWYDVDIRVSNDIKNLRYSGILSRQQPLSEMLNALSMTNELDFKVHNNKKIDASEKKNQQD